MRIIRFITFATLLINIVVIKSRLSLLKHAHKFVNLNTFCSMFFVIFRITMFFLHKLFYILDRDIPSNNYYERDRHFSKA